jgi:hypothetical protein
VFKYKARLTGGRRTGCRAQSGRRRRARLTEETPFDEIQAAIVRRIFQLYAESHGLKQIASVLNEEGVPAPYDDAYRKQSGRGWDPARSASCSFAAASAAAPCAS